MNPIISRMRSPVQRHNAERYLLITLLSFAASVSVTRLFLSLTGYPQIGGGGLHIAHVLWGGLSLFIGALFPLIYANRWTLTTTAMLAGIGVGLFIDEVGKFITSNNDYFYPAAAPIIYAFFLLTALVYLRVRRNQPQDARTKLYAALEGLQEVLDHDLDEGELKDLEALLTAITNQTDHPDLARLATELLDFVHYQDLYIVPDQPTLFERWQASLRGWERKYVKPAYMRFGIVIALASLGVIAFSRLAILLSSVVTDETFTHIFVEMARSTLVTNMGGVFWFLARILLEGLSGLMLLVAAALMLIRRARVGLVFGYYGLLLSLTIVNLLVFYFDQFPTILLAIVQFGVLLGVRYVQRKG